jgi:hypothetical protein
METTELKKEVRDERFPIGPFLFAGEQNIEQRKVLIASLQSLPSRLRRLTAGISREQLRTSYRENGWTVQQVIHHLADSHVNAYVRFKLSLTEENPVIKPYREKLWAELNDSATVSISVSIDFLEAIHKRWVAILKNMSDDDFRRGYFHPEDNLWHSLNEALSMYAWHGKHHLEHIRIGMQKALPVKSKKTVQKK